MSFRRKKILSFISVVTVLCFLPTNVVAQVPLTTASIATPVTNPFISFAEKLAVPPTLGEVTSIYVPQTFTAGKDTPFILHVQDAHAYEPAQRKIKEILTHLKNEYDIKLFGFEGAHQTLYPEILHIADKPETNLNMAEYLVKKGELTGGEWFVLEQFEKQGKENDFYFEGIEEAEPYKRDLRLFRKGLENKPAIDALFDELHSRASRLKSKVFGRELSKFDRAYQTFLSREEKNILLFFKQVQARAQKVLGLDLTRIEHQREYPQLVRLAHLVKDEPKSEPNGTKADLERLIAVLQEKLGTQSKREPHLVILKELASEKGLGEKNNFSWRVYFESLHQILGQHKLTWKEFPHFRLLAKRLILEEELASLELFQELDALVYAIEEKLAETPSEKKLVKLSKDLEVLGKVLRLEASRTEVDRVALERRTIMDSINRTFKQVARDGIEISDDAQRLVSEQMNIALQFYEGAKEREKIFVDRLLELAKKHQVNRVAFVTGGYHTQGLRDEFEKRGVSYATISPRFGESDVNLKERLSHLYEEGMLGRRQTIFDKSQILKELMLVTSQALQELGVNDRDRIKAVMEALITVGLPDLVMEVKPEALEGLDLARLSTILSEKIMANKLLGSANVQILALEKSAATKQPALLIKWKDFPAGHEVPVQGMLNRLERAAPAEKAGEVQEKAAEVTTQGSSLGRNLALLLVGGILLLTSDISCQLADRDQSSTSGAAPRTEERPQEVQAPAPVSEPPPSREQIESITNLDSTGQVESVTHFDYLDGTLLGETREFYSQGRLVRVLFIDIDGHVIAELNDPSELETYRRGRMGGLILERPRDYMRGRANTIWFETRELYPDGSVRVHRRTDPDTGEEVSTYYAPDGSVERIDRAAGGQSLGAAGSNRTVLSLFVGREIDEVEAGLFEAKVKENLGVDISLLNKFCASRAIYVDQNASFLFSYLFRQLQEQGNGLPLIRVLDEISRILQPLPETRRERINITSDIKPDVFENLASGLSRLSNNESILDVLGFKPELSKDSFTITLTLPALDPIHNLATKISDTARIAGTGKEDVVPMPGTVLPFENEVIFLIKSPTGLHVETLHSLFERVEMYGYRVETVTVYDASEIETRNMLEAHYQNIHRAAHRGSKEFGADHWKKFKSIYNTPEFEILHGQKFEDTEILGVYEASKKYGIPVEEIVGAYLEGRKTPLYHNNQPNGINYLGGGIVVYPFRLPAEKGGKLIIVANGHYHAISSMFLEPGAKTVACILRGKPGLAAGSKEFREKFLGASVPQEAPVGSIRRDAHDGKLRVKEPVNPTRNVAHMTDGPLEAIKETGIWLQLPYKETELGKLLLDDGYTHEEISFFLTNPQTNPGDKSKTLFKETSGLSAKEALVIIKRFFPPFYGKGRSPAFLSAAGYYDLMRAHDSGTLTAASATISGDRISIPPEASGIRRYSPDDVEIGKRLLREGKVAQIVLAGGTAGRMGGYDVPESDPRRIRGLIKPFAESGDPFYRERTAFEIQAAHNLWTRRQYGSVVPLYLFVSDINGPTIEAFFRENNFFGLERNTVNFYREGGVPRWNPTRADLKHAFPKASEEEIEAIIKENGGEGGIFRLSNGELSYKPLGHLGAVECLLLSEHFVDLMERGVEYLYVIDNTNLAGSLDPGLIGLMEKEGQEFLTTMIRRKNYYHITAPEIPQDVFAITMDGKLVYSNVPEGFDLITEDGEVVGLRNKTSGEPVRVSVKKSTDQGGSIVSVDGKVQILEKDRLPASFKQSISSQYNAGIYVIDLKALARLHGLTYAVGSAPTKERVFQSIRQILSKEGIATHVQIKEVLDETIQKKRKAAQLNFLLGELASEMEAVFVEIDWDGRGTLAGYMNMKDPDDIKMYGPLVLRLIEQRTALGKIKGASLGEEQNAQILGLNLEKVMALSEKNERVNFGATFVAGHPFTGQVSEVLERWRREVEKITAGKFSLRTGFSHATLGALVRSQDLLIQPKDVEKVDFDLVLQAIETGSPYRINFKQVKLGDDKDGNIVLIGEVEGDGLSKIQKQLSESGLPLKWKPQEPGKAVKVFVTLGHLDAKTLALLTEDETKALKQWIDARASIQDAMTLDVASVRLVTYKQRMLEAMIGPDIVFGLGQKSTFEDGARLKTEWLTAIENFKIGGQSLGEEDRKGWENDTSIWRRSVPERFYPENSGPSPSDSELTSEQAASWERYLEHHKKQRASETDMFFDRDPQAYLGIGDLPPPPLDESEERARWWREWQARKAQDAHDESFLRENPDGNFPGGRSLGDSPNLMRRALSLAVLSFLVGGPAVLAGGCAKEVFSFSDRRRSSRRRRFVPGDPGVPGGPAVPDVPSVPSLTPERPGTTLPLTDLSRFNGGKSLRAYLYEPDNPPLNNLGLRTFLDPSTIPGTNAPGHRAEYMLRTERSSSGLELVSATTMDLPPGENLIIFVKPDSETNTPTVRLTLQDADAKNPPEPGQDIDSETLHSYSYLLNNVPREGAFYLVPVPAPQIYRSIGATQTFSGYTPSRTKKLIFSVDPGLLRRAAPTSGHFTVAVLGVVPMMEVSVVDAFSPAVPFSELSDLSGTYSSSPEISAATSFSSTQTKIQTLGPGRFRVFYSESPGGEPTRVIIRTPQFIWDGRWIWNDGRDPMNLGSLGRLRFNLNFGPNAYLPANFTVEAWGNIKGTPIIPYTTRVRGLRNNVNRTVEIILDRSDVTPSRFNPNEVGKVEMELAVPKGSSGYFDLEIPGVVWGRPITGWSLGEEPKGPQLTVADGRSLGVFDTLKRWFRGVNRPFDSRRRLVLKAGGMFSIAAMLGIGGCRSDSSSTQGVDPTPIQPDRSGNATVSQLPLNNGNPRQPAQSILLQNATQGTTVEGDATLLNVNGVRVVASKVNYSLTRDTLAISGSAASADDGNTFTSKNPPDPTPIESMDIRSLPNGELVIFAKSDTPGLTRLKLVVEDATVNSIDAQGNPQGNKAKFILEDVNSQGGFYRISLNDGQFRLFDLSQVKVVGVFVDNDVIGQAPLQGSFVWAIAGVQAPPFSSVLSGAHPIAQTANFATQARRSAVSVLGGSHPTTRVERLSPTRLKWNFVIQDQDSAATPQQDERFSGIVVSSNDFQQPSNNQDLIDLNLFGDEFKFNIQSLSGSLPPNLKVKFVNEDPATGVKKTVEFDIPVINTSNQGVTLDLRKIPTDPNLFDKSRVTAIEILTSHSGGVGVPAAFNGEVAIEFQGFRLGQPVSVTTPPVADTATSNFTGQAQQTNAVVTSGSDASTSVFGEGPNAIRWRFRHGANGFSGMTFTSNNFNGPEVAADFMNLTGFGGNLVLNLEAVTGELPQNFTITLTDRNGLPVDIAVRDFTGTKATITIPLNGTVFPANFDFSQVASIDLVSSQTPGDTAIHQGEIRVNVQGISAPQPVTIGPAFAVAATTDLSTQLRRPAVTRINGGNPASNVIRLSATRFLVNFATAPGSPSPGISNEFSGGAFSSDNFDDGGNPALKTPEDFINLNAFTTGNFLRFNIRSVSGDLPPNLKVAFVDRNGIRQEIPVGGISATNGGVEIDTTRFVNPNFDRTQVASIEIIAFQPFGNPNSFTGQFEVEIQGFQAPQPINVAAPVAAAATSNFSTQVRRPSASVTSGSSPQTTVLGETANTFLLGLRTSGVAGESFSSATISSQNFNGVAEAGDLMDLTLLGGAFTVNVESVSGGDLPQNFTVTFVDANGLTQDFAIQNFTGASASINIPLNVANFPAGFQFNQVQSILFTSSQTPGDAAVHTGQLRITVQGVNFVFPVTAQAPLGVGALSNLTQAQPIRPPTASTLSGSNPGTTVQRLSTTAFLLNYRTGAGVFSGAQLSSNNNNGTNEPEDLMDLTLLSTGDLILNLDFTGVPVAQLPSQFFIEITDAQGLVYRTLINGITAANQSITVPLNAARLPLGFQLNQVSSISLVALDSITKTGSVRVEIQGFVGSGEASVGLPLQNNQTTDLALLTGGGNATVRRGATSSAATTVTGVDPETFLFNFLTSSTETLSEAEFSPPGLFFNLTSLNQIDFSLEPTSGGLPTNLQLILRDSGGREHAVTLVPIVAGQKFTYSVFVNANTPFPAGFDPSQVTRIFLRSTQTGGDTATHTGVLRVNIRGFTAASLGKSWFEQIGNLVGRALSGRRITRREAAVATGIIAAGVVGGAACVHPQREGEVGTPPAEELRMRLSELNQRNNLVTLPLDSPELITPPVIERMLVDLNSADQDFRFIAYGFFTNLAYTTRAELIPPPVVERALVDLDSSEYWDRMHAALLFGAIAETRAELITPEIAGRMLEDELQRGNSQRFFTNLAVTRAELITPTIVDGILLALRNWYVTERRFGPDWFFARLAGTRVELITPEIVRQMLGQYHRYRHRPYDLELAVRTFFSNYVRNADEESRRSVEPEIDEARRQLGNFEGRSLGQSLGGEIVEPDTVNLADLTSHPAILFSGPPTVFSTGISFVRLILPDGLPVEGMTLDFSRLGSGSIVGPDRKAITEDVRIRVVALKGGEEVSAEMSLKDAGVIDDTTGILTIRIQDLLVRAGLAPVDGLKSIAFVRSESFKFQFRGVTAGSLGNRKSVDVTDIVRQVVSGESLGGGKVLIDLTDSKVIEPFLKLFFGRSVSLVDDQGRELLVTVTREIAERWKYGVPKAQHEIDPSRIVSVSQIVDEDSILHDESTGTEDGNLSPLAVANRAIEVRDRLRKEAEYLKAKIEEGRQANVEAERLAQEILMMRGDAGTVGKEASGESLGRRSSVFIPRLMSIVLLTAVLGLVCVSCSSLVGRRPREEIMAEYTDPTAPTNDRDWDRAIHGSATFDSGAMRFTLMEAYIKGRLSLDGYEVVPGVGDDWLRRISADFTVRHDGYRDIAYQERKYADLELQLTPFSYPDLVDQGVIRPIGARSLGTPVSKAPEISNRERNFEVRRGIVGGVLYLLGRSAIPASISAVVGAVVASCSSDGHGFRGGNSIMPEPAGTVLPLTNISRFNRNGLIRTVVRQTNSSQGTQLFLDPSTIAQANAPGVRVEWNLASANESSGVELVSDSTMDLPPGENVIIFVKSDTPTIKLTLQDEKAPDPRHRLQRTTDSFSYTLTNIPPEGAFYKIPIPGPQHEIAISAGSGTGATGAGTGATGISIPTYDPSRNKKFIFSVDSGVVSASIPTRGTFTVAVIGPVLPPVVLLDATSPAASPVSDLSGTFSAPPKITAIDGNTTISTLAPGRFQVLFQTVPGGVTGFEITADGIPGSTERMNFTSLLSLISNLNFGPNSAIPQNVTVKIVSQNGVNQETSEIRLRGFITNTNQKVETPFNRADVLPFLFSNRERIIRARFELSNPTPVAGDAILELGGVAQSLGEKAPFGRGDRVQAEGGQLDHAITNLLILRKTDMRTASLAIIKRLLKRTPELASDAQRQRRLEEKLDDRNIDRVLVQLVGEALLAFNLAELKLPQKSAPAPVPARKAVSVPARSLGSDQIPEDFRDTPFVPLPADKESILSAAIAITDGIVPVLKDLARRFIGFSVSKIVAMSQFLLETVTALAEAAVPKAVRAEIDEALARALEVVDPVFARIEEGYGLEVELLGDRELSESDIQNIIGILKQHPGLFIRSVRPGTEALESDVTAQERIQNVLDYSKQPIGPRFSILTVSPEKVDKVISGIPGDVFNLIINGYGFDVKPKTQLELLEHTVLLAGDSIVDYARGVTIIDDLVENSLNYDSDKALVRFFGGRTAVKTLARLAPEERAVIQFKNRRALATSLITQLSDVWHTAWQNYLALQSAA